jgi:hypothetical protein
MPTLLADVLVPEVWLPYTQQLTTERSALWQSGIIRQDPRFDQIASQGGKVGELPYFNDLPRDTGEVISEAGGTTYDGLDAEKMVCVKLFRKKGWSSSDLASALAGEDIAAAVASLAANWKANALQRLLVSHLKGIFATALAATHVNDISIADGDAAAATNLISAAALIDTAFLLGDAWEQVTTIVLHSKCMSSLVKSDLVTFVPDSQGALTIPTYLGRRLIVDDGVNNVAGGTSGRVYSTYLFGAGSVYYGMGSPAGVQLIEPDRDSDTGAGRDLLTYRMMEIIHPVGVSWGGTPSGETPSDAELEAGGNWSKVFDDKNIPIVELKTNG